MSDEYQTGLKRGGEIMREEMVKAGWASPSQRWFELVSVAITAVATGVVVSIACRLAM